MGKNNKELISYIQNIYDDEQKEDFLSELEKSVHNYIKTGVKNTQLDELIEIEEEFQKKYEARLELKQLMALISESSKKKLSQIKKTYWVEFENKNDNTLCKSEKQEIDINKVSDYITEVVVKVAYHKIENVIKDTAYLSHVNMLYELYEQEERLRRDEAEYDKVSEKFQKMADITKRLSKQRRMKIEQLQEQERISEKELENLLNRNGKYFNIRPQRDSLQISLSPDGRKYYDYIMNSKDKYSKRTLEQLIYKNCDKVMESLENTCDRGLEFDLELEEISPEKYRALLSKYRRLQQKVLSRNEEIYTVKGYIIDEKEREYGNNEKNRIRIPRRWDTEDN